MALDELIELGAPSEQVSVSDLPQLDVASGIFSFTVSSNTLREGRSTRTLVDGTQGLTKWVAVTGEVTDLRTRQSLGRTSLKFFLNTKGNWLASNLAVVCGLYDRATGHSKLVPAKQAYSDGTVFYNIPELNGKTFCVGLVRGEDWTDKDGKTIPQYDAVGVLSAAGLSATHVANGTTDRAAVENDYHRLESSVQRALDRKKSREAQVATQLLGQGGGVSVVGYGATGAFNYDAAAANLQFEKTAVATAQAEANAKAAADGDEIPF